MIWLRSVAVILGTFVGSGAATAESRPLLERSIGRVLLVSDEYPNGRLKVAEAIDREYNTVRRLPVDQRVRFFWAVLMNVRLDAGYSVDLVELIARDCDREFEQEITAFLKRDWEGGPPQPQADIAKRTLTSLQILRSRKAAQQ